MAYFPNGSSGLLFDEQCARCRYGDRPDCPIYRAQYDHNYSACNNPEARAILDLLVHDDGECQMFKLDVASFTKPPEQGDLFPDVEPLNRLLEERDRGRDFDRAVGP